MKNSKKYAKEIIKLFRSLKQKHSKVGKVDFDDPVTAIIYAVISEQISESAAKSIEKKLRKHFVDFNDLRVSRREEVLDVMGNDGTNYSKAASLLTEVLNSIYNKYNMVDLTSLTETGKRQARKELEHIKGISRFVINYCFLTALGGHAVPFTQRMVEYFRAGELVHPKASDADIEGFLERQIPAANAYEFYLIFRQASEKGRRKAAKKDDEQAAKKPVKKKAKKVSKKVKKATKKTAKKKKAGKTAKKASEKTSKKAVRAKKTKKT